MLYPNTTSTVRNERIVSGKKIMINNINLNQERKMIENRCWNWLSKLFIMAHGYKTGEGAKINKNL